MDRLLPEPQVLAAIAIAVVCVELSVVGVLAWRRRPAIDTTALACNLAAGLALLIAMYAGFSGAGAGWVAAGLTVALVAHVADLVRRLDRRDEVATARGGAP